MKRQFVCGMVSTIVLGLAVWAQTSAGNSAQGSAGVAPPPGSHEILRLHIAGPFVICEATDPMNNEPALEVLAPNVKGHFPPHWYSDGKDHATYQKMTYHLVVGQHDKGISLADGYGQLDVKPKDCRYLKEKAMKDDLYNTIWLPLPNEIIPTSPAKVEFNDKCDDSLATAPVKYSTKMDLAYTNMSLANVSVCVDPDCSVKPPWLQAEIKPVNDVGDLSLEMAQVKKDSFSDPHKMAKKSHRKMRHLADLDEHCPHFSNEDMNGYDLDKNVFQSHTDCHAPLLIACAPGSSSILCKGEQASH